MKIFLDSCDIPEIVELHATGLVDGVTTNPTLLSKGHDSAENVFMELSSLKIPISAEVISTNASDMIKEAEKLIEISEYINIKLPVTFDGLVACKYLADQRIDVNTTLCFSESQALLAAKAGARYISVFVGRLDDVGTESFSVIHNIRQILDNYGGLESELLVASVRNLGHIVDAASVGADIATVNTGLFRRMYAHDLTDKGIKKFLDDWNARKSS